MNRAVHPRSDYGLDAETSAAVANRRHATGDARGGGRSPPAMPHAGPFAGSGGFERLDDEQWTHFLSVARSVIQLRPAEEDNTRRFVEAVLTVMSGRRFWVQLPSERFGKWYLHHHRHLRWLERGVWLALAQRGALGPERSRQMIGFVERQRASLQRQRARRRERLLSKDG